LPRVLMPTKMCTGPCGKTLDETEFHWRNKKQGIRIARCRKCSSLWSKDHYKKNTQMYVRKAASWNKRQRHEVVRLLIEFFKTHPCVDCGETDPVVLQFDHVRGKKIDNVGSLIHGKNSWEKIKAEIDKCEERCANCHVRKTAKQFKWLKALAVVVQR
jgi:hypothetical protein